MPENVHAQVILRSSSGASVLDAGGEITAATIGRYTLSAEEIGTARKKLEAAGLAVVQVGPVSVSIACSKERFERVFGTTLVAVGAGAAGGAYYRVERPVVIPDDLADVVADVVLPPPPELF